MTTTTAVPLHPDFDGVEVRPGHADIVRSPERFDVTNIIALGGAPDMLPHVPTRVGQVGTAVFWESTGAADALPFWNTNLRCDVLLYLISGSVRVEFKELEGTAPFGSYTGRTGDLMLLPKDIAHRTFSGDGKRRISLEIIEHDRRWDDLGWVASVPPDDSLRLGPCTFDPGPDTTAVAFDGRSVATDSSYLLRGCRAILAYGLHLGHNEFEGGLVLADGQGDRGEEGDEVVVRLGPASQAVGRLAAVAALKGLVARLEQVTGGGRTG